VRGHAITDRAALPPGASGRGHGLPIMGGGGHPDDMRSRLNPRSARSRVHRWRYRRTVAKLTAAERAKLPDRAFAYIDDQGRRRLPIHDEAHVRNALARFERVRFPDDASRDRARRRLLNAAKRYGIVPVGFMAGQLRSERSARSPDYSSLPSGSVAFLLTDIEGSTVLLRKLGDDYAALLRDVRAVIRSAVRREGGHKVDTHGDEYLSVFERPASAVQAAVDLQRGMDAQAWPDDTEVRVRAGLHTGRPTLTESGYVGLAVHTVARICTVGHGGQILMSDAAKRATAGSLPEEVRVRRLGAYRLAGLARPETLYQVQAPGLRTRFPALRIAD
jgi:class 3 adenylate cyclase